MFHSSYLIQIWIICLQGTTSSYIDIFSMLFFFFYNYPYSSWFIVRCMCICTHIIKLATKVEGNLKAPFSLATLGVGEGIIPFHGLLHLTFDLYLIILSVKQGDINYRFWVFGMTQPGIELCSPQPLVNTLPTRPMGRLYTYISQKYSNKRVKNKHISIYQKSESSVERRKQL